MIRGWLRCLAGGVVVASCFWNLHATDVMTGFQPRSQEEVTVLESQYLPIFFELIKTDPAAKRFGYMTAGSLQGVPPDPDADRRSAELRYLMIPRILVRSTSEPYVIGDFRKGEPLPTIPENLVEAFDSGNGMILYRQRQTP